MKRKLPACPASIPSRLLLAACLGLGALGLSAESMFHGDATHAASFPAAQAKVPAAVAWTFQTGGPVISSPVVEQGRAYVGSDDGKLYALDLVSGKECWRFETAAPVRSSPAVGGGLVYFGSYDGWFYAVDASTGKERWKFAMPGERRFAAKGVHGYHPRQQLIPDFWDLWQSSPTLAGGRVYFGSGDGKVYALDAATGAQVWSYQTGDVVHGSASVADGLLYIGSFDRFLYALDAATGELRWRFETGEDKENHNQEGIQSTPAVVDGVVYFGARDFNFYALDARTGVERWRNKITWSNASPAVANGRVHYGTSIPAFLVSVDLATGKETGRLDTKIPVFSSPVVAGDLAFFGCFNGVFHVADLRQGKTVWQYQTEASKANTAGVLDEQGGFNFKAIFTSRSFEDMYHSGRLLFGLGAFVSSPTLAGDLVLVGSADGSLYAFGPAKPAAKP